MFEAFKIRKPWAAAVIAFVDPFIGMLYLGRAAIAFLYFGLELATFVTFFYLLPNGLYGPTPQSLLGTVYLPIRLTGTVHAFVVANRRTTVGAPQWYARWYIVLLAALCVPAITMTTRMYFFEVVYIARPIMAPTLNPGDSVAVSKWAFHRAGPHRGDVVLFYSPQDDSSFVMRVVGLPGETVRVKGGALLIEEAAGARHDPRPRGCTKMPPTGGHKYLIGDCGANGTTGAYVVPMGRYLLLGDNRRADETPMYVASDAILGKVVFKFRDSKKHKYVFQTVH